MQATDASCLILLGFEAVAQHVQTRSRFLPNTTDINDSIKLPVRDQELRITPQFCICNADELSSMSLDLHL
jgi:hypothetical protein